MMKFFKLTNIFYFALLLCGSAHGKETVTATLQLTDVRFKGTDPTGSVNAVILTVAKVLRVFFNLIQLHTLCQVAGRKTELS